MWDEALIHLFLPPPPPPIQANVDAALAELLEGRPDLVGRLNGTVRGGEEGGREKGRRLSPLAPLG